MPIPCIGTYNSIAFTHRNLVQLIKLAFDHIKNTVGKGENASYQYFLFQQCFQKLIFLVPLKDKVV